MSALKWKERLKTLDYKSTSPGPRNSIPILEMLHVLLWDDCKRWVIPLWWNIPTDDTQYVCCNFNLILSLKQQINILNIMWSPCERSPWAKMSWPIWETSRRSLLPHYKQGGAEVLQLLWTVDWELRCVVEESEINTACHLREFLKKLTQSCLSGVFF